VASAKLDVYEMVTDKIVAALEKGIVPWQRPWTALGGPRNLQSKRPYGGLNAFLLSLSPYTSPYWTTFKAAKAAGGSVKKGEKGTIVVFWKILEVDDTQAKSGKKKIPLLRYYTVFNTEQCEGLNVPDSKLPDFEPIEEAQRVIDNMPEVPVINFGGDRAYYAPMTDEIQLPMPEVFDTPESYYQVAYHELAHSTGHEKRLHRIKDWSSFGSEPYAQEELVAEMASAMVCGAIGLDPKIDSSAAYIDGWLAKLKNDKKFIMQAAGKAQKASDFILGLIKNEDADSSASSTQMEVVA
jgi:antirestriction protein ArdC